MNRQTSYPQAVGPHPDHPFCREAFYHALISSKVVGTQSGWEPLFFTKDGAVLPSFLKAHSYGEYIFDWQWADLYQRHGRQYYPKMLHALPFTPVNAPKIWGAGQGQHQDLMRESLEYTRKNPQISGEHYLFIDQELNDQLRKLGFFTMYSMQYHWKRQSDWQCFDDFLSALKKNRRKMIKKERQRVLQYDLRIEWKNAGSLNVVEKRKVYDLYLQTIAKKNSYAYLNEQFFMNFFELYPDECLLLLAYKDQEICAMSLFVTSATTLYGRYWGIDSYLEQHYPLLHFEMCYYRGMEYCLEKGLGVFEAGAQGEQKLWRGFYPVKILSAHYLKEKDFHQAISGFVSKQNEWQIEQIEQSKLYLPYQKLESGFE